MNRDKTCIKEAISQYEMYKNKVIRDDYLVVVDMSKPSSEKRLFVLENLNADEGIPMWEVVRPHHCAHGIMSRASNNANYADKFSNTVGSKMTSLGAMVTAETYTGKHGYSLRLDGLEKGKNDNVRKRAVVIHSAKYVTDDYIQKMGRAGSSEGCFAVDPAISKSLIDLIKGGVFLYCYYPK